MPPASGARRYEFAPRENEIFSRLARAMTFVAAAMLIPCAILGTAAVFVSRSTLAGSAIFAPLAIAAAIMAVQLFQAASHFRRIVTTQGSDIQNLMVALDHMAKVYRVWRWLWVVVSAVVVIALATTTTVGR